MTLKVDKAAIPHVFIDTNIYLRFFAYSSDALEELAKFAALAEAKKVALYLTDQVKSEIIRNRDGQIASAVARFDKSASAPEIPRFITDSDEAKGLLAAYKELAKKKSALSEKMSEEIGNGQLRADALLASLELHSDLISFGDDNIKAARLRRDLGNPPGKDDSLGDQLNWELLLISLPDKTDLHIITADKDFASKLDEQKPNSALLREWQEKNGGNLYLYASLSGFAKSHFPEIKLPSDVFKYDWISRLSRSDTFATTHAYIKKLEWIFADLTLEDAVRLFQAMIENPQINWISDDDDVKSFYKKLYDKYAFETPVELDGRLQEAADYLGLPF